MELYCDIAQLDVMSNLEIDSAKRENPADNTFELQCLKKKYDVRDEKGRHIRPLFFRYIDSYKGYRDGYYIYVEEDGEYIKQGVVESYREAQAIKEKASVMIERGRMTYQRHETSMDYLELAINKFRTKSAKKKPKKFSDILVSSDNLHGQVWYPQVNRIIDMVRETKKSIAAIWSNDDGLSNKKKRDLAEEIRQECIDYVCNIKIGEKTMRYIVGLIDSKDYVDISRFLFGILFGVPNEEFYKLIELSKTSIYKLQENQCGDVMIYDFCYKRVAV